MGSRRWVFLHLHPQSIVAYVTRRVEITPGGFCSGRGDVCVVPGISIKMAIPWEGLPKGEGRLLRGDWEPLALYMHTKFEVSCFSHFGDISVSQNLEVGHVIPRRPNII